MFYFFCFFEKQKNIDFKKASWPKFCNIIFLFLLKIGSVWPVDQQINMFSSYNILSKNSSLKLASASDTRAVVHRCSSKCLVNISQLLKRDSITSVFQ